MKKEVKQKMRSILKGRRVAKLPKKELHAYLEVAAQDFVDRFGDTLRKLAKE